MTRREAPQFPASAFPEVADQKLLGIYPQRQDGFVLQRVRIPGGRLSPGQLRMLVAAAQAADARPALHLTTRQDIEIHGLAPEAISQVQAAIAEAGLTTVGSAGDTLRNSAVDPLGGRVAGCEDLLELAQAIESAIAGLEGAWSLPRKFKISFSGDGRGSMRPWITDVGIVAQGGGAYTAIVAGSLGAKPGSGVLFAEDLSAEDVAALAIAAVRLHAAEGDRENRRRARLRHARERMGDDAFLAALRALWEEERSAARTAMPARATGDESAAASGPAASLGGQAEPTAASGARPEHVRLAVPHGDLPLADAFDIADVVERAGGELRLGIEHDLHLFGVSASELPSRVAEWSSARRIVACPGTALCTKAAGPTAEAADALTPLAEAHPELLFALSGCPNSCSHAASAGVGITARMRRIGDERLVVFNVAVGGEAGGGPRLAQPVATDVALEDLARTVEAALREGESAP